MAHEVHWLIPDHVLFNKYFEVAHGDDTVGVLEKNLLLTGTTDNTFYIVLDLKDVTTVHTSFGRVPQLLNIARTFLRNPRLKFIVAYGAHNQSMKFLATIVMQVTQTNIRFVQTYDDALDFLILQDPSLTSKIEALCG